MSEHTHPLFPRVGGDLSPGLEVHVARRSVDGQPAVVLRVSGELDGMGAPVLWSVWEAGVDILLPRVVVDLRRVEFCNAAGLRVLARISVACRSRGLTLTTETGHVLDRLLPLVGMTHDLQFTPAGGGDQPVGLPPPAPTEEGGLADVVPLPGAAPNPVPVVGADERSLLRQLRASARWARALTRSDLAGTVTAVLDAAREALDGVESAGLLLLVGRDQVEPRAGGGSTGRHLDELQRELRQGPGWHSCPRSTDVFVDDLRDAGSARRWPELVQAAAGLPVRAVMSLHLSTPGRPIGALTLCSVHPAAFDEGARGVAQVLAALASSSLAAAVERDHLGAAIASRDLIGQAKGILMERHRLTADQAFEALTTVSCTSNTKLITVAEQVATTGEFSRR